MGRLPNVSIAQRCNLHLPPGRIRREILRTNKNGKMNYKFLIALAAAIEFALRLLFRLANAKAREEASLMVEKRHLVAALENNFLKSFFRGVYIPSAALVKNTEP